MADAGIGGFFMHARAVCRPSIWARSGLRTSAPASMKQKEGYARMGIRREWLALRLRRRESQRQGGEVPAEVPAHQDLYPDLEDPRGPRVISCFENYCSMSQPPSTWIPGRGVIADFLHEIYEPYYEKYGTDFDGFFTDEPQISPQRHPVERPCLPSMRRHTESRSTTARSSCSCLGETIRPPDAVPEADHRAVPPCNFT